METDDAFATRRPEAQLDTAAAASSAKNEFMPWVGCTAAERVSPVSAHLAPHSANRWRSIAPLCSTTWWATPRRLRG